jgi:D-alanyl-D-alanine carboxypeptidase (penicillin-binding protein 5/6)
MKTRPGAFVVLVLIAAIAFVAVLSASAEDTRKEPAKKSKKQAKSASSKSTGSSKSGAKSSAKSTAKPTSSRGLPIISKNPYLGLVAVDGATGQVLVEDNADVTVYPASVIKMMTLFVVMDRVQQGTVRLTDQVTATAEASTMGGSQVYLKEGEVFSVEDLIYALMVQSANDAAVALAIHVAGSQLAFVEMMNKKAQESGLTNTHFYSCHGLPPTPPRKPQEVDVSTPRDLAALGRMLVQTHPGVIQYTSTLKRDFRTAPTPFVLENHNRRLMASCQGVDGLKTGYVLAGGYSTVATAKRNDRRVFVAVCGSEALFGKERDKAAAEAFNRSFASLPPIPIPSTNVVAVTGSGDVATSDSESLPEEGGSSWLHIGIALGVAAIAFVGIAGYVACRRNKADCALPGSDRDNARRPMPPLNR